MKTITASQGQTLEDIAVQQYGCLQGCLLIMQDNGLGLDDDIHTGQMLLIRDEVPQLTPENVEIARIMSEKAISPNSGIITAPPAGGYIEAGYFEEGYIK